MGNLVVITTAVVWLLFPKKLFVSKFAVTDRMGGGKQFHNGGNMLKRYKICSCYGWHQVVHIGISIKTIDAVKKGKER